MKGLILALDGSTYSSSAALLRDGELLAGADTGASSDDGRGGRGEALVPVIAELLAANGTHASEIEAIVCGAGPGSFTSLRIAASVAKGIASVTRAKIYAVSSLLLTVASDALDDGNYLSVLPAMRGELFALEVSVKNGTPTASPGGHSILAGSELAAAALKFDAKLIGPGQELDRAPHARGAPRLLDAIIASGPVDLDSWEPDYGRLAEAQVKWESAHGRPLRA